MLLGNLVTPKFLPFMRFFTLSGYSTPKVGLTTMLLSSKIKSFMRLDPLVINSHHQLLKSNFRSPSDLYRPFLNGFTVKQFHYCSQELVRTFSEAERIKQNSSEPSRDAKNIIYCLWAKIMHDCCMPSHIFNKSDLEFTHFQKTLKP